MGKLEVKRNERDWAGQLVSWIKSSIQRKTTIFQDVTNDTGIRMESGRTKFPDILLFTDKISGIIFNGWELKFPDTPVDDPVMLDNALEKAKKLRSESFVTWNGTEAVIWKINTEYYSIETLFKLKSYPKIPTISLRDDLADPVKYARHEEILQERAKEILHDLDRLCRDGQLKPAINISGNIIRAISKASEIIIPQFQNAIIEEKGNNKSFRHEFAQWKVYEGTTLKILETSSRRNEMVIPEQVLAKFTFYNLIGKVLFYLTLSENLCGELERISLTEQKDVKSLLDSYFDKAKKIDYQAIFKPYFTDGIKYSETTCSALLNLLEILTEFDFKVFPTSVIGHILENLVPPEEKQKFGQYFTPETLANLVAYPAIQTKNDILFDPTAGTGTFLNAFYKILHFYGNKNHTDLLSQIWGNDVSHFPAILSVINLYKQDVTETENFPRVIRDDFFNIEVGKIVEFPDSHDHKCRVNVPVPLFDGIASNFPFIQQEDIPNDKLVTFFRAKFREEQQAFFRNNSFKINEKSDYFIYCIYNSVRFLKQNGCLSAITSNAWLGKEYGFQFKKFLLDNFHIKYIVKSNAERWFKDSQVSTVYFVLEKVINEEPTRFVTLNFKLEDYFCQQNIDKQIRQIEEFYGDIDNCDNSRNINWVNDDCYKDLYKRNDGTISVCVVTKDTLIRSIEDKSNWAQYFISSHILEPFKTSLTQYYPRIIRVIRGKKTCWNKMFVIKEKDRISSGIASRYRIPYLKSPRELNSIAFDGNFHTSAFVCKDKFECLDKGTQKCIMKFKDEPNTNHSKTISQVLRGNKPFWYSLSFDTAQIVTAVNPNDRLFFAYSEEPFSIDQRLIAISVQKGYDVELITALLNSAVTLLMLEIRGTSRNLGALDLNANYLKQLCVLNPDLLSDRQKNEILKAFEPLRQRKIGSIIEEIKDPVRIAFDKVVFNCFGLDESLLPNIYSLLRTSVMDRISMKRK